MQDMPRFKSMKNKVQYICKERGLEYTIQSASDTLYSPTQEQQEQDGMVCMHVRDNSTKLPIFFEPWQEITLTPLKPDVDAPLTLRVWSYQPAESLVHGLLWCTYL